jgi:heat shock protein HslJ
MAGKAPKSKNAITLRVDRDGSVAGQAPINRYAAESVVSATGGWSLQNPNTTKRLGTPEEMDEEALFMRLMVRANKWDKHGSQLDLLEGKRVLMSFKRGRK